mgnify:CR=1 FL=1
MVDMTQVVFVKTTLINKSRLNCFLFLCISISTFQWHVQSQEQNEASGVYKYI